MIVQEAAEGETAKANRKKGFLSATLVYLGFDVRNLIMRKKEYFPLPLYDPKYTHVPPKKVPRHLKLLFPAVPRVMIFIERSEKNFN